MIYEVIFACPASPPEVTGDRRPGTTVEDRLNKTKSVHHSFLIEDFVFETC
jgi:hypothetical protein